MQRKLLIILKHTFLVILFVYGFVMPPLLYRVVGGVACLAGIFSVFAGFAVYDRVFSLPRQTGFSALGLEHLEMILLVHCIIWGVGAVAGLLGFVK